jgi:predicted metalloprotease
MAAPDLTQIKPEDRLAFLRSVAEPMSKALEKMFAEPGRPYEAPILDLEINNNGDTGGIYAPNRKAVILGSGFFEPREDVTARDNLLDLEYTIAHELGHHAQNLVGIYRPTLDARKLVVEAQATRVGGEILEQTRPGVIR